MSRGCTYLPNDIIKLKYNKIEFLAYGRSGVMTALGPSQWKGSHPPPKNTSNCPYNVEFTAKPIPSASLHPHSIEAGRVQLDVFLTGSSTSLDNKKVKDVNATMVNQIKQQILTNKLEEDNNDAIRGKQNNNTNNNNSNTSITIKLQLQDKPSNINNNNNNTNHWIGEFIIPSTWLEGGTETFQRSGSYTPSGDQTAFSLQISYKLTDGKICTALFNSADAFHWSVT
jgi:hypothetical protein